MKFTPIIENIEKIGTPEQRAKWVKGLRSGNYTQIRKKMCHAEVENSACCLHVAAVEVDGVLWGEGIGCGLPHSMESTAEFALVAEGVFFARNEKVNQIDAPTLNDINKLDFNQIADLIEGKEVNA